MPLYDFLFSAASCDIKNVQICLLWADRLVWMSQESRNTSLRNTNTKIKTLKDIQKNNNNKHFVLLFFKKYRRLKFLFFFLTLSTHICCYRVTMTQVGLFSLKTASIAFYFVAL